MGSPETLGSLGNELTLAADCSRGPSFYVSNSHCPDYSGMKLLDKENLL